MRFAIAFIIPFIVSLSGCIVVPEHPAYVVPAKTVYVAPAPAVVVVRPPVRRVVVY